MTKITFRGKLENLRDKLVDKVIFRMKNLPDKEYDQFYDSFPDQIISLIEKDVINCKNLDEDGEELYDSIDQSYIRQLQIEKVREK